MGVRVRMVDGMAYIFINHRGQRKAKKVGEGEEGRRMAEEAARIIEARLALGDLGILEDAPSETFRTYAEEWLESSYVRSLKARTQENYRQVLRNHWTPTLGHLELAKLTRQDVSKEATAQLKRGLKISTVCTNLDVLQTCLKSAAEDGKIAQNPASKYGRSILRIPTRRRRKVQIFTQPEIQLILQRAQQRNPAYGYPLILLLIRTGLRIGEALTLQITDVNFENRDLWVRRTWGPRFASRWQDKINSPKSGERRVDMSQQLCRVLADNLRAHPRPNGWLFPTALGQPMTYPNFRQRYWQPLFDELIPYRTVHVLRHTLATWLIQNGESLAYIKDLLGHSSIKITVDIYGHLVPGSNKMAVDRLDDRPRDRRDGRPQVRRKLPRLPWPKTLDDTAADD